MRPLAIAVLALACSPPPEVVDNRGLAGATAPGGSWAAFLSGPLAPGRALAGAYRSRGEVFGSVNCSWKVPGSATGNLSVDLLDDSAKTVLCTCILGGCAVVADHGMSCACGAKSIPGAMYEVAVNPTSDCSEAFPEDVLCNVEVE